MHNMFNENAKHGKFLHLFPSLLGSRTQLVLNGGRYPRSETRQTELVPNLLAAPETCSQELKT